MGTRDALIEALERLCQLHGGHKAVADEAGVSADYLWQILNGTPLPSGQPRGVGARLARKIDAKYPGWANMPSPVQAGPPPAPAASLAQAVEAVARAVASQPRTGRLQLQALLADLAASPEDRAETCEAIMRVMAPSMPYSYSLTWEEAAREVAAELGDAAIPARQFIELADENHGKSVRLQAIARKSATG